MNDIQAKENIYSTANAAVEQQQNNLANAENQLLQVKNVYLQSVIQTALQNEKLKRKRDLLATLIVAGSCCVLALILLLINVIIGVLFIIVALVTVFAVKMNSSTKKMMSYNNRKGFFASYAHVLPAGEQLKWKKVAYPSDTSFHNGWTCSKCMTKNTAAANFCVNCGLKKS